MLRLLTDDELDQHPHPGAVLPSWLDAPEREGVWTDREVYWAVLNSRHHTVDHLRQLPADEVLARSEPDLALPHLLAHCGNQPERWNALLHALDYGPTNEKITLGELLNSIKAPSPSPARRHGLTTQDTAGKGRSRRTAGSCEVPSSYVRCVFRLSGRAVEKSRQTEADKGAGQLSDSVERLRDAMSRVVSSTVARYHQKIQSRNASSYSPRWSALR